MSEKHPQPPKADQRRWTRVFRSPFACALCALLIVLIAEIAPAAAPFFVDRFEDISYGLFPSAGKAYAYGLVHFSEEHPDEYDIPRAEDFFYRAAALDPRLPYVWHELARISFLEDDFPKALAQINIQIAQEGDATPNSYYVRGLIEGYMDDYPDAERDYAHFLALIPISWPGVNDYSWVLLKDNKPQVAATAIAAVLPYFPDNPWLLNSDAIALYEIGSTTAARAQIAAAAAAVASLTPQDWSHAYPGNDPNAAAMGVATFKAAVLQNKIDIEAGKTIALPQS